MRVKRIVVPVLAALALVGFIAARCVPAANDQAKAPPAAEKKKEPDLVHGKADFMKSVWGEKKTVLMKGNVKFVHGDTVLTSDQVEYDEKTKTAVSPGEIHLTNPDCDITGAKGVAYFNKKLGVIEGEVVMHVRPKPAEESKGDQGKESPEKKFKQPTTITCPKLEYLYKSKIATATGGVDFRQEKRTARAENAVYDLGKELLTLTGSVSGVDEDGQTFCAPGRVVMSLKKGDEWMEAENASASFKVDLGEEKR